MNDQPKKSTTHQNARPTIAYLAPNMTDGNSLIQWSGVVDAARQHDANLIGFPGWSVRDPHGFYSQANILYDLVTPQNVDGIVSWASSLGNYTDLDTIIAFHARYHPLPIVTIGRKLDNMPALLMDSYVGMRAAIVHLIEEHGFRRLAFIRGPESHFYAQERYRAYTETLEEYGIALDSQLVTPPFDWGRDTGAKMMTRLLDERNLRPQTDFEAIVAANDDLLLGVLDILRDRGIRVPGQVAAVGFDNNLEGQTNIPPLTSVAVPFYEAGYQAVEMLLDRIAGRPVAEQVAVPSQLKIRRSCGCLDPVLTNAAPVLDIGPPQKTRLSEAVQVHRSDILADMTRAMQVNGANGHYARFVEGLLDSFVSQIEGTSTDSFLTTLEDGLIQTLIADSDSTISLGRRAGIWQGAISGLRRSTLPYLSSQISQAENLWQQSRVLIGDVAQKARRTEMVRIERHNRLLQDIGAALITTFDVPELVNILASELPALGIPGAYLSLYEQTTNETQASDNGDASSASDSVPQWSRLILACLDEGRAELPGDGLRFPSRDLVPEGMWPAQGFRYIAEPLYFRDHQLGLALFENNAQEGRVYDALREQLSSALQGALLLRLARQHAESLEAAVTETIATAEEMRRTITQTESRVAAVADAVQKSVTVSRAGQDAVADAVNGMTIVSQQVETIAETILALAEQTEQIDAIISAVQEVAGQSKMLALNARIEAARAGERGRTFAVVANEMKQLSQQSREATAQVQNILHEIQQATNTAVVLTEEGSKSAQQGVELVNRAGEAIRDLTATIEVVANTAAEIATTTRQQTIGMDQLVVSMQTIQQGGR